MSPGLWLLFHSTVLLRDRSSLGEVHMACALPAAHHAEAVHTNGRVHVAHLEPDVSKEVCCLQVDLFEDTQACAIHAKRITIM